MSLPVERSITVSAPKWTAMCSLSSSSSTLLVTAELPMLALILHLAAMPIAHRLQPAGQMHFVRRNDHPSRGDFVANQLRREPSRLATNSISGVIWPARAARSWVVINGAKRGVQGSTIVRL